MKRMISGSSVSPILLLLLATQLGCGSEDDTEDAAPATARAQVTGLGTNAGVVSGSLTFTPGSGNVTVAGQVQGLAANSVHGFHLHMTGDCSDPTGMSAGGHWNPAMHMHGAPAAMSHLGDLGNITAGADGVAPISVTKAGITIADAAMTDVIGRAVIVHADPDDLMTDPTGMAGARIACGVVTR